MEPSKNTYSKTAFPSTHSIQSSRNSFKHSRQQPGQKLAAPFAKLQHLFIKHPKKPKPAANFTQNETALINKKNITCINLGMEEEQLRIQPLPKGYFPNRMKLKEFLTCRDTQPVLNATFYERPTPYKRHRHKSLANMIEKYALFAGNKQKENLEKFEKKMVNSLAKKEDSEKFATGNIPSGIRFVYYCKPEFPSPKNPKSHLDPRSEKVTNKWRVLAQKFQNDKLPLSHPATLKDLNPLPVLPKSQKKLTRKPSRQNSTLDSLIASLNNVQNLQSQKQIRHKNQSPQAQHLQTPQKQEASIFLKDSFKFSKLTKTKDSGWSEAGGISGRWESSKRKLRKLLGQEKSTLGENKLVLTPWEWPASEKEIDLAPA